MSHKRNEALRHVQHSMHHVIAAGEGSDRAPDSCKLCPYYRPDFKFRTCLYAHCPYKKQVNVFRSTPEKWDIDMEKTQYSKLISAIPKPDIAISMGCNVSCPFIGIPFDENWGLDDPTGKSDDEFKAVIEQIRQNVLALKSKLCGSSF